MRTTLETSRLTYTQARHDTYKTTNIMPTMTTYLMSFYIVRYTNSIRYSNC